MPSARAERKGGKRTFVTECVTNGRMTDSNRHRNKNVLCYHYTNTTFILRISIRSHKQKETFLYKPL